MRMNHIKMYSINLILLTQLYSVTSYLYAGHEYDLNMQDYYSDAAHRSSPPVNFQSNIPTAPAFLNQPPAQVTFLNETGLVLPCSVYAQPKPTIKWLQQTTFDSNTYTSHNNTSSVSSAIFNNENSAILRYQRADGSLVFAAHSLLNGQSTNENYKSIFQCSAANKFGTTLSRPVKVGTPYGALEYLIRQEADTYFRKEAPFFLDSQNLILSNPASMDEIITTHLFQFRTEEELNRSVKFISSLRKYLNLQILIYISISLILSTLIMFLFVDGFVAFESSFKWSKLEQILETCLDLCDLSDSKKAVICSTFFVYLSYRILLTFFKYLSANSIKTESVIFDTSILIKNIDDIMNTNREACWMHGEIDAYLFENAPKNSIMYKIWMTKNSPNQLYMRSTIESVKRKWIDKTVNYYIQARLIDPNVYLHIRQFIYNLQNVVTDLNMFMKEHSITKPIALLDFYSYFELMFIIYLILFLIFFLHNLYIRISIGVRISIAKLSIPNQER